MWTSSLQEHESPAEDGAREQLDVVLIGPYPPPLGGVASHLVRVADRLQQLGLAVGVVNHFRSRDADVVMEALHRNPLRCFLVSRRLRAKVIHFHHSRWSMLLAFALSQRRSRSSLLITFHGMNDASRLRLGVPVLQRIGRWALARFDRVIAVNHEIEAYLRGHVEPGRMLVLPAFVPPAADDVPEYEPQIATFFENGVVIVVSAYRVDPLKNGGDLYGLDLAVEAFLELAPDDPRLKLAVLVARPPRRRSERGFLGGLRRRVEQAGFGARVLWATELPLLPAFRHDTVFIRPTRMDGDSVSIREALHNGVPVVASDAVPRPAGVATFASGNAAELRAEIETALRSSPRRDREGSPCAPTESGFVDDLLALYGELVDGSAHARAARR